MLTTHTRSALSVSNSAPVTKSSGIVTAAPW
jgi:hypothetical protein